MKLTKDLDGSYNKLFTAVFNIQWPQHIISSWKLLGTIANLTSQSNLTGRDLCYMQNTPVGVAMLAMNVWRYITVRSNGMPMPWRQTILQIITYPGIILIMFLNYCFLFKLWIWKMLSTLLSVLKQVDVSRSKLFRIC